MCQTGYLNNLRYSPCLSSQINANVFIISFLPSSCVYVVQLEFCYCSPMQEHMLFRFFKCSDLLAEQLATIFDVDRSTIDWFWSMFNK